MKFRTNRNLLDELMACDSKYQLILLSYIIKRVSSPIVAVVGLFLKYIQLTRFVHATEGEKGCVSFLIEKC